MANFLMRSILGRTALIAATTIGLSACVAKDTSSSTSVVSSSSSEMSSSIGMVSSSSSAIASSVTSISSSSSVAVASSSASVAPSSSSIASSSSSVASNCSDAAFCDDFESGSIGGAPNTAWKVSAAGSLAITNEKAYSGTKSIKVKSLGQKYNRNFMTLDLANIGNTKEQLYGRMMVWADDPGNAGGDFTFVQAEGAPKSGQTPQPPAGTNVMYRYRVDSHTTNGNLMANYDTWLDANNDNTNEWNTDCGSKSNSQLPRGKWSCVEWHFDAVANELRYWLNGNELSEMGIRGGGGLCLSNTQKGNWTAPAKFERLNLGVEQYDNGVPARTLYIDDVKLDSKYVGCPDMPVVNSSSSQTVASSSKSAASSSSALSMGGEGCNGAVYCNNFDSETSVPAALKQVKSDCSDPGNQPQYSLVSGLSGKAIKVVSTAGHCTGWVTAPNVASMNKVYVKYDVNVAPTSGNLRWFTLLEPTAGTADIGSSMRIRIADQAQVKDLLAWNVGDGDPNSPDIYDGDPVRSQEIKNSTVKFLFNTWACYEVMIDKTNKDIKFWANGKELLGLEIDNDGKSGFDTKWPDSRRTFDIKSVLIGYGGGAGSAIVDNIVVSNKPIGCK